nr:MAG TPA: hypothetical protein [Caudoviricetes sp.]
MPLNHTERGRMKQLNDIRILGRAVILLSEIR